MDYSTPPLISSSVWTEETPFKRSLLPSGTRRGYVAANVGDHERAVRDECSGWSVASALRFQNKLMSVSSEGLPTHARALSLTFGKSPSSPALMHGVRRAFLMRLLRRGLALFCWHCEFQPRIKYKTGGVPHFHMAAFWDLPPPSPEEIARLWVAVSRQYNSGLRGQYVLSVWDLPGWLQYQGKHGSRGVYHYQRQIEHVPPAWQTKTGRMWGFGCAPGYQWNFQESSLFSCGAVVHRDRDLDQLEMIANGRQMIADATGSHFTGFHNGDIPRSHFIFARANKHRSVDGIIKARDGMQIVSKGRRIKQTIPEAVQQRIKNMLSPEELKRYEFARNGSERRRHLPARVKNFKKGFSSCRGGSSWSRIAADKFYAGMVFRRQPPLGFVKDFQTDFNIMDNVASSLSTTKERA